MSILYLLILVVIYLIAYIWASMSRFHAHMEITFTEKTVTTLTKNEDTFNKFKDFYIERRKRELIHKYYRYFYTYMKMLDTEDEDDSFFTNLKKQINIYIEYLPSYGVPAFKIFLIILSIITAVLWYNYGQEHPGGNFFNYMLSFSNLLRLSEMSAFFTSIIGIPVYMSSFRDSIKKNKGKIMNEVNEFHQLLENFVITKKKLQ